MILPLVVITSYLCADPWATPGKQKTFSAKAQITSTRMVKCPTCNL
jgi:DNA-directed RNA polymerase subunit RPC12/RpoP